MLDGFLIGITTAFSFVNLLMVIGGCVGSTGGGIKVMRLIILERLMLRELYKLRVSSRTITNLVIDNSTLSDDEIHRTSAILFTWIIFLIIGGGITAFFTNFSPFACFSGMFSALGNIGPCYLSVNQIINIPGTVKLTFIIGMLVGRLEILPVLLLFSKKAWR
jgi:trk system potassium uptake protein TrkH